MRTPLLTLAVTCAALLAPLSLQTHAQTTMAPRPPTAVAASSANARVIVKYRADSALGRVQALSASGQHASRAQALGQRVGMTLTAGAGVGERAQVMFASGISSEQLARRLAAESDIEYAVPDQRRRIVAAPNDTLYTTAAITGTGGGPVSGQWYLHAPAGEVKASIDAEAAWNITTGSPSIVVAVLDTGIRYDHPDLKRVADGGNLMPGYDMVKDPATANDGDGRDADPSDPGDWITAAETNAVNGPFNGCGDLDPSGNPTLAASSTWHGTQTSGLIGALTNNGTGMASVGRTVRVLPVRVLGKCGGYDSDIIAGMRWAVNLPTGDAAVPANPNPARVINMSLGGEGACSAAYVDAVSAVNATGAVVVASAGNSSGHAVSSPANCPGVIAVSGLRHIGSKVAFSDLGPEISISAPGGNCVNTTGACLYPILTTSNAGTTTPVAATANGAIYTDAFNPSLGTSFSAPLVAGTAALMLSVNPSLTPEDVKALLKASASAKPFPTSGADVGTQQCIAPQPIGATQVDQGECYCTTSTCGAGMLNAGAAVTAAKGLQALVKVTPANSYPGVALTLTAGSSILGTGHSIASYRWAITDSGGGIVSSLVGATDGSTVTVTPSATGRFSVNLTLTDSTGLQSTAVGVVDVTSPPPPAPSSDGGGGGGALGMGWLLMLGASVLALRALGMQAGSGSRRHL